jgi:hypothetical protein
MWLKGGLKSIKLALQLPPSDRFRSIGNSAKTGMHTSSGFWVGHWYRTCIAFAGADHKNDNSKGNRPWKWVPREIA